MPESNLLASVSDSMQKHARVVPPPPQLSLSLWFLPENSGVELAGLHDRKCPGSLPELWPPPHHYPFISCPKPKNAGVELAGLHDREDARALP
jgi:hypothetical protein